MEINMKKVSLVSILLSLVLIVSITGCGSVNVERVKFTPTPPPVTSGGLSLDVNPMGLGEISENDELSQNIGFGMRWLPLDPPLMRIKVVNTNQHIVRFTGSVIKLVDKDKIVFDVLSKGKIKTQNARSIEKYGKKHGWSDEKIADTIGQIEDKLDELHILDESAEILPGFSGEYYLAFDLPTRGIETEDQYNSWVMRHAPFTLMLFDVITSTDKAGNVELKSRFEFPISATQVRETYQDGKLVNSEIIGKR